MINFDFVVKTKIYFGVDKHLEIGSILKEYNVKKVLIVIGKGSVRKSGLLDVVTSKLDDNNITYQVLEGVRPNPTADLARQFVDFAKKYQPDYLLAIGGGSVMDTAKLISVGYHYDGDCFDFNLHKVEPQKALPVGVILTISASGSEMSTSCVIQDDETMIKRGFNSELVRPVFAIENPELSFSVNQEQTSNGITDIMMHTLERYFQPSCDNEPADGFAEALLKSVIKAGEVVMEKPNDYESRAVLMLMSSLSHNGLTNIGKKFFMPVHQLEHSLSGVYPSVAHGAGLAVLFPAWAKYYVNIDPNKFDKLARNVFGLNNPNKLENGLLGIKALEDYFKKIHMPLTFKDLGIDNPDIDKLVNVLLDNGKKTIYHHIKPIDEEIARIIYEKCVRPTYYGKESIITAF